jgi:MoxR-like ATPase
MSKLETTLDLPGSGALKLPTSPGLLDLGERVSFLGVEVLKGRGGQRTPKAERFKDDVLTEWDLKLMQKLAVGLELNQAVLLEGGSGIGKSSTVDRMCGYLNREVYYANCSEYDIDTLIGSRTIGADGSVVWRDGIVTQWLRTGGVLFLDEYNFMRGEVRGRLHEVLDSVLRGTGTVSLTENYGEQIAVHPDCRLIAAQNAPGGENSDREKLDAPQLTRFVYIKEVDDLPKEVKLARALGAIGEDNVVRLSSDDYLSKRRGDRTALKAIPGIKDLIERYVEFADKVEELVKTRQAGKGQPQPVHFSSERDRKRVFEFVETFYDGDPNGTFQKALRYYYKERFSSETDRKKVEELIKLVETDLSAISSKRKGLDPKVAKAAGVTGKVSLKAVQKVMGKNCLGAEEWKKGFNVEVGEVPAIPGWITKKLLEEDCQLHPGEQVKDTHILVLVPKRVNGEEYSALKLGELCAGTKGSGDKLIYDREKWANAWKGASWAKAPQVESEWVLIPKMDPDRAKVSDDKPFRSKKIAEQDKVHEHYAADYRESKALELMTVALLNYVVNGERILSDCYLRTQEPNASGGRVEVGYFLAHGLRVDIVNDDYRDAGVGRSLARKSKS